MCCVCECMNTFLSRASVGGVFLSITTIKLPSSQPRHWLKPRFGLNHLFFSLLFCLLLFSIFLFLLLSILSLSLLFHSCPLMLIFSSLSPFLLSSLSSFSPHFTLILDIFLSWFIPYLFSVPSLFLSFSAPAFFNYSLLLLFFPFHFFSLLLFECLDWL